MSLGQNISGAVVALRDTPEVKEPQTSCSDEIEKIITVDEEKVCHQATPLDKLQLVVDWMGENLLLVFTTAGAFMGLILGLLCRLANPSPQTITLVSFPGELLMRLLKMFILPLIISSLISGMARLDPKSSGMMGFRALIYYIVTTILAAIVGIVMVLMIHPGDSSLKTTIFVSKIDYVKVSTIDAVLDIIRNMVPENLVQACFQQAQTTYVSKDVVAIGSTNKNNSVLVAEVVYKDGTNVMGIIVFCITFGLLAGQIGPRGKLMVDFFVVLNEIIMKLVSIIVMWYAPIGIMCLIAGKIMSINNLGATAQTLGLYVVTVILGLSIHGILTLPTMYWLLTRQNPGTFFRGMMQAWVTALGTASSAATLPVTFRCLEENNKIDPRVTRFIVSVGATVNMDGTALYEAVAAIFIAQMNGISLGLGEVITVSLTATLASIGAASIPGAALITMFIVLTALGLPTDDVPLLFAVDWLLDRFRTSINVLGDGYGAGIVYYLSKDELEKMDQERKLEGLEMGTHYENISDGCQRENTPASGECSETKI
ncbi:PREDICTED: excitatory amino acid transporter-like isoform X2 [Eufriesea mexicana]|uniref:excitatory amino acid transporter-like isoform X2 n=1 Tax=Eufriesea mexicana TaxID=516756 RepID=UPI00083C4924|nr:PREDICTED: excitatory amino acid transporter-like isoform X2 [Eufriesea mexicana]